MKAHSRFANYKFSRFENYATGSDGSVDEAAAVLI